MHQHVTVVPSDRLIIVDGEALHFDFPAPVGLHALQWHEGSGHMEWTEDLNHPLTGEAAYTEDVAPFVTLWEAEKSRREQEAAEAEVARLAEYNSTEARAARVRVERDRRISATDYLMTPDYPLADDQRAAWTEYRQALRDITEQAGFPWQGGGEDDAACPWPTPPALLYKTGLEGLVV